MRPFRARVWAAGWLVTTWLAAQAPPVTGVEYVTAIRHWSQDGSTRVAIEVSAPVQFRWQRADNPPRILVDLPETRLKLQEKGLVTIPVGDPRVTRIRAAHNQPRMARVVLDLEGTAEYDVKQLSNPFRIVLEVRAVSGAGPLPEAARVSERTVSSSRPVPETKPRAAPPSKAVPEIRPPSPVIASRQVSEPPTPPAAPATPAAGSKSPTAADSRQVIEANPPALSAVRPAPGANPPQSASATAPDIRREPPGNDPPTATGTADHSENGSPGAKPPAELAPRPVETRQAAEVGPVPGKPAVPPPPQPKPAGRLSTGERSMIRALGLKLGRVVIDPGHGGHDQGTAGPTGLLEKELVLDVAQRLGELIESRLGSEILYTRTTDVFIPLEERGAFANQHRGDLFLSVHANSSPYKSISGAETYYLNFTNVKADLEVAARENASTNKSIFELRELLQKIVLKDKIGESREFAARVQRELASTWSRMNESARNRGVKKAPFVVLIGASMPSILAEIGFVSNAKDEALMKKPEHRQKLAEALFRGVSQYAAGLSQTQVAQRARP